MIELDISAVSRVGCVRANNEDMILVGDFFVRDDEFRTSVELKDKDRYMMAVADGMGGHNSGDVASSLSLHNLQFFFHDIPSNLNAGEFNESIIGWLDSINHVIDSKGTVDMSMKGMGTTLVALVYYNGDFYSLNCGDSRLYRFRKGELCQLTTDHSLDNMLGEAKHSSVITNCIPRPCVSTAVLPVAGSAPGWVLRIRNGRHWIQTAPTVVFATSSMPIPAMAAWLCCLVTLPRMAVS